MPNKCRIAIIGTGQRGCAYMSLLKNHPEAELAALCDTSSERLNSFAEELECAGIPRFTSLDELLDKGDFEAVIITTPDFTHAECAIACFNAGKHVMLEKPMAPTVAECRRIIHAAVLSGKILQVGFVLRCHPLFQTVKKLLGSGTIGQLLSMNCAENIGVMHGASYMRRWHRKSCNSGGFLLAKCSHDLDLMVNLAGAFPTKVASFGGLNFFTPDKLKSRCCSECSDQSCRFRFHGEMVRMTEEDKENPSCKGFDLCVYNNDKDIVDNQQVMIEYANGVRATFSLNLFAGKATRKWHLTGTTGYLDADTANNELSVTFSDGREPLLMHCQAGNESGHGGSDLLFLNEFVKCVFNGNGPELDTLSGLSSNIVADAAEQSRRNGTVVTISPEEFFINKAERITK